MTAAEMIQELLSLQTIFRKMSEHNSLRTRALQVTRSFDFIRLEWKESEYADFCRVELMCSQQSVELKSVYCEEKSLEDLISHAVPTPLTLSATLFPFTETVALQLRTADRIASLVAHCAAGDDYRPGHFSKVRLAGDHILLSQINHMNSRSLSHKENYSLRNLEFFIPLTTAFKTNFRHDYRSGDMLIRFEDDSSNNNRRCGDRLRAELEKL
jgi:hypothetical protein